MAAHIFDSNCTLENNFWERGCGSNLSIHTIVNDQRTKLLDNISLQCIWQETWGCKGSSECGDEASKVGIPILRKPTTCSMPNTLHQLAMSWRPSIGRDTRHNPLMITKRLHLQELSSQIIFLHFRMKCFQITSCSSLSNVIAHSNDLPDCSRVTTLESILKTNRYTMKSCLNSDQDTKHIIFLCYFCIWNWYASKCGENKQDLDYIS